MVSSLLARARAVGSASDWTVVGGGSGSSERQREFLQPLLRGHPIWRNHHFWEEAFYRCCCCCARVRSMRRQRMCVTWPARARTRRVPRSGPCVRRSRRSTRRTWRACHGRGGSRPRSSLAATLRRRQMRRLRRSRRARCRRMSARRPPARRRRALGRQLIPRCASPSLRSSTRACSRLGRMSGDTRTLRRAGAERVASHIACVPVSCVCSGACRYQQILFGQLGSYAMNMRCFGMPRADERRVVRRLAEGNGLPDEMLQVCAAAASGACRSRGRGNRAVAGAGVGAQMLIQNADMRSSD